MKNYRRLIADFARLIETGGGDEPIPVIPNFLDRSTDVRATPQQTA